MALATNNDFANRELSVEELDRIAAGVGLRGPGPIISPPSPHWAIPPHGPSPIWFGGPVASLELL
jgi:hypothetical protein